MGCAALHMLADIALWDATKRSIVSGPTVEHLLVTWVQKQQMELKRRTVNQAFRVVEEFINWCDAHGTSYVEFVTVDGNRFVSVCTMRATETLLRAFQRTSRSARLGVYNTEGTMSRYADAAINKMIKMARFGGDCCQVECVPLYQ